MASLTKQRAYHWSRAATLKQPLRVKPSPSSSSLEGVGISVSVNPNAWRRIARTLGGYLYEVSRLDGKPLVFEKYTKALATRGLTWAKQQGLLTEVIAYGVTIYDEEGDEAGYITVATWDEALREADEDEGLIRTVKSYRPEGQLLARLSSYFPKGGSNGQAQMAEIEAINMFVAATMPERDGIWWSEMLDVVRLSAPRGVILPHALERVQFKRVPDTAAPDSIDEE